MTESKDIDSIYSYSNENDSNQQIYSKYKNMDKSKLSASEKKRYYRAKKALMDPAEYRAIKDGKIMSDVLSKYSQMGMNAIDAIDSMSVDELRSSLKAMYELMNSGYKIEEKSVDVVIKRTKYKIRKI